LQVDDAALFDGLVRLEVIDCLIAIDPKLNSFALTANTILIPVAPL
jgi:hypothetical protein